MREVKHPLRIAMRVAVLTAIVVCAFIGWHYLYVPVLVLGPMVQQVSPDGFAVFCMVHGGSPVEARIYDGVKIVGAGLVSQQTNGRYIITFGDLHPGRQYEYRIAAGKHELARHPVRTAPMDNRPFRLLAFGDSGEGGWSQYRLADRMIAYRPDIILHTGDLIYPKGRLEDNPRKFFQPYAELLATVPIYPCLGNHEYKMEGVDPVSEAFVLPPNGPSGVPLGRNYWFDYGNARFVSIDGNNGEAFFRDLAAPWLEGVLGSAGNRWRIVFFHPPVYTHGRYLPERYVPQRAILKWIVPVMDRHGVELVLCGHNHMYERTRPLRGGQIVEEGQGTIHVTTGAGGANLTHARLPMPDYIAVWNDREHSFTVADISADTISLRQVGESGLIIDEYRFGRRSPASAPAK